jgi:2-C-methyl-D-erythritol 4-phosphate cytidylyltransferase
VTTPAEPAAEAAAEDPGGTRAAPVGGTRAALVVMAAGSATRMGLGVNKVLLPLAGRPMLCWSLSTACGLPQVTRVVVVAADRDEHDVREVLEREMPTLDVQVVVGGASRHASEWHALRSLAPEIRRGAFEVVVVHDAARPLAGTTVFEDVTAAAARYGGAVPVRPQHALVTADGAQLPSGQDLVTVQTPQAFRAAPLLSAYEQADRSGFLGTDTASSFERYTDLPVRCVVAPAENIKVTVHADLRLAEALLVDRDPYPALQVSDDAGDAPDR